ncbi:hypothetical protein HZC33_03625 [Candidatus Wolfebacteria bacterium]|nr:hypothetical protein [Candidatus Wolfebacteria bacterium]
MGERSIHKRWSRPHSKIGQEDKHDFHDSIVDRIFENPQLLGNHFPYKNGEIVLKVKEPHLPNFYATKNRGSVIDILAVCRERNSIYIVAIEVKVGYFHRRRGFSQIGKAAGYFKRCWKEWMISSGIEKSNIDNINNVYFLGILAERPNYPEINFEKWVKSPMRFCLNG